MPVFVAGSAVSSQLSNALWPVRRTRITGYRGGLNGFRRVYGRYLPDNHHSIANNIGNITGMGEDPHAQRGNKKNSKLILVLL